MIAPSRAAGYRRFYLYSALSITVVALAIAALLLVREGLHLIGLGDRSLPADVSRAVALAVALIAFAVPVGGAHLWVILRSLRYPLERAAGVRHQFLELWVTFALLAELLAGSTALGSVAQAAKTDVTGQSAVMIVAALVAALGAWWIRRTAPASFQPRVRGGVVLMLVSMAFAAFSIGNAASAAGGLFAFPYASPQFFIRNFDPRSFQEQTLRSSYLVAGLALGVWSFGYARQRAFRETRDRLAYALAGYGLGCALVLFGAAYGVSGAIRFTRDPSQAATFAAAWPALAAGALLIAVHATLLLGDRGRNGHPPVTTTRLLLAFPALVGLAAVVGGLGLTWHAVVERDVVPAHFADDLIQAGTLGIAGVLAFVPSWLAFDARTAADSAVRRFYLFTVVCLALVAGLTSGVIFLYNAITTLIGVGSTPGAADSGRAALTWAVPALVLAAIFAIHLRLLVRDQRVTRAAEVTPATDPLVALLEDVRAGRVSVERAAETIRHPAP